MARAMLSNAVDRNRYRAAHGGHMAFGVFETLALAEARAILRETEPGDPNTRNACLRSVTTMRGFGADARQGVWIYDAASCLAEALTAFVEGEVR